MSDRIVTVAITFPGATSRVLVQLKNGATRDPDAAARAAIAAFLEIAPKHWQTEVVSSTPITDVPIHPETF